MLLFFQKNIFFIYIFLEFFYKKNEFVIVLLVGKFRLITKKEEYF